MSHWHLGIPVRTIALSLAAVGISLFGVAGASLAQPPAAATVGVTDSDKFGPILVDRNGMTLYTWFGDEPGISMCPEACTTAWPPALVEGNVAPPPGLPGTLGMIRRTDGTTQLTYNDWPLYRFSGDRAPGEINGDGSLGLGALWQAAATGAVAPSVMLSRHDRLGPILTDSRGMTLYTFAADSAGMSTCSDACATAWPPARVEGNLIAGAGLSRVLDTTMRDDGAMQATLDGMPLYTFVRDTAPGDANGEGVTAFGGLWSIATTQVRR